jgi:uncharacterized membrane protein
MPIKFMKTLKDRVRGYFFAGILVILPLGITLYLITTLLKVLDQIVDIIPAPFHPETYLRVRVPGLGLVLSFILVILTGMLVKNYIGQRVVDFGEHIVSKIPLVRPVYGAIKQITKGVFGEPHGAFKRAVVVEFPRQGVYSLGFVTGPVAAEIESKAAKKLVSIFIPTTPNPTSGFYLMVPEKETIPLSMSVEDAFKLLISVGMAAPGDQSPHFQSWKWAASGRLPQPVRREGDEGGS